MMNTPAFIQVVLPVIDYDSDSQEPSFGESIPLLSEKGDLSKAEIEKHVKFKRSRVLKELKQLLDDGIEMLGSGRGTRYRIK